MNPILLKYGMLLGELHQLRETGAAISPQKVLSLIKLEKKLWGQPETKYTDWIPLNPAEKMAEDAKQVVAPSKEELQSMKDVFNIDVDDIDEVNQVPEES